MYRRMDFRLEGLVIGDNFMREGRQVVNGVSVLKAEYLIHSKCIHILYGV